MARRAPPSRARSVSGKSSQPGDLGRKQPTQHLVGQLRLLGHGIDGVREPVIVGATDFLAIPTDGVSERLRSMVAVASRHRMLGEIINNGDASDH